LKPASMQIEFLYVLGTVLVIIWLVLACGSQCTDHRDKGANVRSFTGNSVGLGLIYLFYIFLAIPFLCLIDTNDFELSCSDGMCYQTQLMSVHKVGLLGFAPKYFRSHVEPFAFPSDWEYFVYAKKGCGGKSKKNQTKWVVALRAQGEEHTKDVLWYCNDEEEADFRYWELSACIKKSKCYYKIESEYWEEVGVFVIWLFLLYTCFLNADVEILTLNENVGTLVIKKKSVIGYTVFQIEETVRSSSSVAAFTNRHVKKNKEGRESYKYSVIIKIDDSLHEILLQKDQVTVQNIVQEVNSFCKRWKGEDSCVKVKSECVNCFDRKPNIMFLPCGHVCVCNNCSSWRRRKCPLCKAKVKKRKRIYLPSN